ncbi:hypothetical protein BS50DRAFT_600835 [Corynespora cassiicola Philippines]|uniref:N-acetyltransferase domain-containing protein n=1 Tax=Corynespora cassiicola Philippines TaxID=1448308 RepID=A0A2T2NPT8_CORCC|nr:hypothetical protein BS50DRAFT_600835 [Corynespora cassiicola Philippines]
MNYAINVNVETDFDELITCEWESYEQLFQSFFRLFCPVYDSGREDSLKQSIATQLEWHKPDPHAHWLKVMEKSTGKIVGGAWYKIYTEDSFTDVEEEVVDWYPEDSTREFVSQASEQLDTPRMLYANRPQVFLNIIFTRPDYQRKDLDKAKELDVEFWLNATRYGKPLYEKNYLMPKTDNPDEKWTELEKEMGEMVFWTK